jgi:hypothetical protein
MRPARVTAEEHAAFNAKMPKLRKAVKAIKVERCKFLDARRPPDQQTVQRRKTAQAEARERMDYWFGVLQIDRKVRAPVRLWDALNKLRYIADVNEVETDYFEKHPGEL